MPNFFSAFTSEVFRPIATLMIPGAIGISTWIVALLWHFDRLKQLVSDNHGDTTMVVLLAMIFAGLVFEDFGTHCESWLDKRADNKSQNLHTTQWFDYLRSAFRADPIGRRYIRSLVLKLKFELGVAFAMFSAATGTVWLAFLGLSLGVVVVSETVCFLFVAWGLVEAFHTHQVLGRARAELLKDIRIVG